MTTTKATARAKRPSVDEATSWLEDSSPAVCRLIERSWQLALAGPGEFAADFYDRVFAADPDAVALFPGDMSEQRRLLTKTMGAAIELIGEPEELELLLRASGARHAHYGVVPRQFDVIGAALIATVADRAGSAFDGAHRAAWEAFYSAVSAIMRDSMRLAKKA